MRDIFWMVDYPPNHTDTERTTMSRRVALYLVLCLAGLTGCSSGGGDAEGSGDHVWSTQTQALEKAKDVNNLVQENFDRAREDLERQER
jgi:hypothetical protein